MKAVRVILTALFTLAVGAGLYLMATGKVSIFGLALILAYIAIAAALNQKGGMLAKVIAYIIGGVFSLLLLISKNPDRTGCLTRFCPKTIYTKLSVTNPHAQLSFS